MADEAKPARRWPLPPFTRIGFFRARLGRLILLLNLAGLLVLVIGALVLNEFRQGLIDNRKESLMAQAETMGEIIAYVATAGDPEPYLSAQDAVQPLARFIPPEQRARLFDTEAQVLTDSYTVSEQIDVRTLPPVNQSAPTPEMRQAAGRKQEAAREALETEVKLALTGERVASVRYNEKGEKVVSVSVPIRRVKAILGVLTLEAGDVDAIVAAQRWAMLPFILVALGVSLFSSLLLHWLVSRPIHRLSDAADAVRMQKARTFSLPDLESRSDEVGILARSLQSMTEALQKRMDEIDRFAADVSHEIKNPLTSIRSALETLHLVKDDAAKARLMAVIQQDVRRADRLITDISNASRLDAELARDVPKPVDVGALLEDIVSLYQHMPDGVAVSLDRKLTSASSKAMGREGPLGQVFRNIIDNARSFSPEGGTVRVSVAHSDADPARPLQIVVEDDGPGIPEENLETIFQRFYTSRPKGTDFGRNSGLGLSISRQIIEAQGGRIWAQNRANADGTVAGARFTIALPNVYQ